MTEETLKRGNRLLVEIKEVDSVLDHFNRFPSVRGLEFLANVITKCQNLGSESLKNDLALSCIEHVEGLLSKRLIALQKELDEL